MLLGEIIKEYRAKHNLSLQDFADKIGTSRSYIHMLEKNINYLKSGDIILSNNTI